MYQAIFTDGYELQRFDPKKRLRPVVVKFDDLEKFLVKDAKGFLLNPTSTALPLLRGTEDGSWTDATAVS